MKKLKLTARIESIDGGHARVGVFQNGGKSGVLVVDAEQATEVTALINTVTELLEALQDLVCRARDAMSQPESEYDVDGELLDALAAIAKAKGGS